MDKINFSWLVHPNKKNNEVPFLEKHPKAEAEVKSAIRKGIIETKEEIEYFKDRDYQWYWMYLKLLKFKKQNGHCRVKAKYSLGCGFGANHCT